jgi:hypothetical protein
VDQERSYRLVERDFYGRTINTIGGLDQTTANMVAHMLRKGDAYTCPETPRTCELVAEPTEAELIRQAAEAWLAGNVDGDELVRHSPHAMAEALELVAARLRTIPRGTRVATTWLKVDFHVFAVDRTLTNDERRAAVDLFAGALGGQATEVAHGHYKWGDDNVRVFGSIPQPIIPPAGLPTEVDEAHDVIGVDHAEHGQIRAWEDQPGQCGVECACGTAFDGFASLAEAVELLDRHIADEAAKAASVEPPPERIAEERVDQILAELNVLTRRPDEAAGVDWWDWVADQPEFDREATSNTTDTCTLHLLDGTVLTWHGESATWKRQMAVAA